MVIFGFPVDKLKKRDSGIDAFWRSSAAGSINTTISFFSEAGKSQNSPSESPP
jgi:hypothetical protein